MNRLMFKYKDRPPQDAFAYAGERVVDDRHIAGLLCPRRSVTHREPDLCLFQSRSVVRSVTGYRHDLAHLLKQGDETDFVLGTGTG